MQSEPRFDGRLWEYRMRRNLSQRQLARAVGTSLRTYLRWEQGTTIPNAVMAQRLADLLNCRVEELFPPDPAPLEKLNT